MCENFELLYDNPLKLLKELEKAFSKCRNFESYIGYPESEVKNFVRNSSPFFRYCISPERIGELISLCETESSLTISNRLPSYLYCKPTLIDSSLVYAANIYLNYHGGMFQFTLSPRGYGFRSGTFSNLRKIFSLIKKEDFTDSEKEELMGYVVALGALAAAYGMFDETFNMLSTNEGIKTFSSFVYESEFEPGINFDCICVTNVLERTSSVSSPWKSGIGGGSWRSVLLNSVDSNTVALLRSSVQKILVTIHDKVDDEYITTFFDVPVCISSYLDSGMYDIELVTALYFLIVEYLLAASGIRITTTSISNASYLRPLIQDMDYPVFDVATTAKDIKRYVSDFLFDICL